MYLQKLIILNYRSCNEIVFDFSKDEPNVFIGINDCGKSTILKAIDTLLSVKPLFNFPKDDKKKNDLSNTRATIENVTKLLNQNGVTNFNYSEQKCYILGKFQIEDEELLEEKQASLSPQLVWVLDNIDDTNKSIWLGKEFDENSQTSKDLLLTPDNIEDGILMKLYNLKDTDLRKLATSLGIKKEEIENDNSKGKPRNMELARAIYKKKNIDWYWIDYDTRVRDSSFFPQCRYLDWNISLEQLTQFANDAINSKINNQVDFATKFANRQAQKAQNIVNQEFESFVRLFAQDIPNIVGFKANLSFQLKSVLTDILINKSNTDKDIHIEQQGEGVKRQIWFALLKWQTLSSVANGVLAKKYIWCFDEPETHLYPKSQREFFDLIKDISEKNIQSFISTHSTVFIDRANFNSIYRVELDSRYTKYSMCKSVSDIFNSLQIKNSDFLFFDKFLVVEGDTEEHLIPHLFYLYTAKPLLTCGVQIINLGGKEKRSQNKRLLEGVLADFNKSHDSIIYLFDNDIRFDKGVTSHELNETTHYLVGKQDIEDSIPLNVWLEIICGEITDIKITIEELQEIHEKIPNDCSIQSNQKFYPKLRSFLKKEKFGEDTRHIVDDKLPDKGRASAELLSKYIKKDDICLQIISAFNNLVKI
jgi:putative ATP-dependent endonuclease of the OLD family